MKKRKSLLDGLKPEQIKMLLWWADEEDAMKNGTINARRYTTAAISKREKLYITDVSDAIHLNGTLRIER